MDWTTLDPVAIEVAHWSAVLPLAWLLWVTSTRDTVDFPYWLVAVGFSVSVFADLAAAMTGVSGIAQPFYLPVQFALFAFAFTVGREALQDMIGVLAIVVAAVAAVVLDGPDSWIRFVGSVVVLWLARAHALGWSMLAYCGLGTVLYLGMLPHGTDVDAARPWWYGYQSARLLAFGLFILTAHREARRA